MKSPNRKIKLIVFWWLLVIISVGFSQPYTPPVNSPLANHEHPRLYFTDSDLIDIRDYINNYEAQNFQLFINTTDGYFSEDVTTKSRASLLFDANGFAFLSYAVHSGYFSGYTFGHSASEYAQKAYDHAVEIDNRIRNQGLREEVHAAALPTQDGGYVTLTLGTIYDWCFDYLNLTQKQMIADAQIYMYDHRDNDVNPGTICKLANGSAFQHVVGGGVTFWGDNLGSTYDTRAQELLDATQWLWYDRIFLMGEHIFEQTSGWSEGVSYIFSGEVSLFFYIAAISSALDINFHATYKWLHDIPLYLYFKIFPMFVDGKDQYKNFFMDRNDDVALVDWIDNEKLQQMTATTARLKNADPDMAGFYKWVLDVSEYKMVDQSFENKIRYFWLFYKFLWGIRDVVPKAPDQVGIKKSYRFGLGETIFRSDLETQNATKINFYAPGYNIAHHAHRDEGHFTIWKYGTLVLDAGCNKTGGHLPKSFYSQFPIYHNVVAFYPANPDSLYGYNAAVNDHADAYDDPDNQPGGRNHMGTVLAKKFKDDEYDFMDLDYTPAYKGENWVNRLNRKFLYIRDPNAPNYTDQEYVIIVDDIKISDGSKKRRWLLHTPYRPNLLDGNWSQMTAGFWTANSGSELEVTNTYSNAHGKMFMKILAPSGYQLRLRGGSDANGDYWYADANGTDLSRGIGGPFDDWAAFWVGSYRLEIEDLSTNNSSQYVVVMQIGDANTLTSMAPVTRIDTPEFTGAFINQNRVAMFNMTENPLSTLNYSVSGSASIKHIVTGLQQGVYYVKKDGNLLSGQDFYVDEGKVLSFTTNGGGAIVISKSEDTTPPQIPQGLQIQP